MLWLTARRIAIQADEIRGLGGGFVPMGRKGLARGYWASPPVKATPSAKLQRPPLLWAFPP
ncbi:hypothetical protein SISSUDRAFT_1046938 [Sistotremastrum suecicum HHB10207 ss-3]|uniref:Uncharacterized protein n=1 Tax=Sistotremastrum suecicum HHB10207 ss-3 TaxID=1314776 RepID=A0A166DGL7_9AGAM|nr:hypothetical protein SISSUDRAFT_1046938 [Sistotremastrum suecicum HHB10207 ss-3]